MKIPSQLVEVIDIGLAGFRKENEAFVISIFHKEDEILQIINRNMTEECKSENGEFGIVLSICFDEKEDKELLSRFTHSHFKFDAIPGNNQDDGVVYYFLPLAENSEKSANKICKLLEKIFLLKTTQHISCEIYGVEE